MPAARVPAWARARLRLEYELQLAALQAGQRLRQQLQRLRDGRHGAQLGHDDLHLAPQAGQRRRGRRLRCACEAAGARVAAGAWL